MKLKFEKLGHVPPPVSMTMWGAVHTPYGFVIAKMDEQGVYSCSWKNSIIGGKTHYMSVDSPTFEHAQSVCEVELKKLLGYLN